MNSRGFPEGHRVESHNSCMVLWWTGKLGEIQVMGSCLPPSPLGAKGEAGGLPDVGTKCGIEVDHEEKLDLDGEILWDSARRAMESSPPSIHGIFTTSRSSSEVEFPGSPQELQECPREQGRIFLLPQSSQPMIPPGDFSNLMEICGSHEEDDVGSPGIPNPFIHHPCPSFPLDLWSPELLHVLIPLS